jgi:crotonobetainyl-CoA:carnitine CoA-transferase CaiB-like acyl-CoA transferase
MPALPARDVLRDVWTSVGASPFALDRVTFTGAEPVLPSSFPVSTLAQASIAAACLAAAEIYRLRTGRRQDLSVDMRHAAIEFRSERYLRTERPPSEVWDKIAGLYRTEDGRWVRIHTNFAHHRDGILALLNCAYERDAVQAALLKWTGDAFEAAAAERNLVATMTRTPAEWAAHPQGQAVAALPLIEIIRIGDAPPRPLLQSARPLDGVRVLDLTRIIAGPVAGRVLAGHGAEVLHVTSPNLPSILPLVMDTGRGKRPTFLDLDADAGRAALDRLVGGADIFLQGYRPGGLAARGFSPEQLAQKSPGIVVVSLSAYGHTGPWAGRRGFDSLTQNANGINFEEAAAVSPDGTVDRPKELPCQALDHGAGHLLAFGAMVALHRRAEQGGSWLVRTSLAQVGHWLQSIGRVDGGMQCPDPKLEDVADLIETSPSGFGVMRAVRHAAVMATTPVRYASPAIPLGTYPPDWLPKGK